MPPRTRTRARSTGQTAKSSISTHPIPLIPIPALSLTEEVQRMFCVEQADVPYYNVDVLSLYARSWIFQVLCSRRVERIREEEMEEREKELGDDEEDEEDGLDEDEQEEKEDSPAIAVSRLRDEYEVYSGLQWSSATSTAERIALTTSLPHETAVRQEFTAYEGWLEDIKHIRLREVAAHPVYGYLPLPSEGWQDVETEPQRDYWMDLYPHSLYYVFRRRPDNTPVSLPVLIECRRVGQHAELWVREHREEVELTAEEEVQALVAARAEKYKRVMRGVKRGREADAVADN